MERGTALAAGLIDGDPQRLGAYWLAGRLGAGGQGVVYEAYGEDGRRVAVKVLHGDPAGDPELRERFGREATAARRVASFCTAAVIAADLDGARPYIVSEYIQGASLRRAVADGRRFSGDELHRLGTAIATALTAIHDAGVIHRDMKPDNVLLGPDGPRVIDFGVARTLEMSLSATGLVTGTPTYMAPEVFTGQRAGTPADVFAWGGIMLFAATGEDPFKAESLGGVMHRVLSVDPDLSPLPGSLRGLVADALAKDPHARPTARELLLALVSGDGRLDTVRLLAEGSREAGLVRTPSGDPGLGALAEDAYATLGPAERELVPEVFLRLVAVDDDGHLRVRRARRDELPEGTGRVLEAFSALVPGDEREIWLDRTALPHAWPRLRSWVQAGRDGLAAHGEIRTAARRWKDGGRRAADLFHGSRLESALRWAATERRGITLSPAERDFLDESTALARRRVRRGRVLTATLAVLLVAALAAGGVAVRQSAIAGQRSATIAQQHDRSEALRIAALADSLRVAEPVRAMLLSVAAWRLAQVPQTRSALHGALARHETAAFRDPATDPRTIRLLSRDSRTLVSVGEDAVRLWDVRTGRKIGGFTGIGGKTRAAALSPSGRTLAVLGGWEIRVWDVPTGRAKGPRMRLTPLEAGAVPAAVRFGAAEDLLIVDHDERERIWNLRTGEQTRVPGRVLDTSPDGLRAIVDDVFAGDTAIWTLSTHAKIRLGKPCESCVSAAAYGPGGKLAALTRNGRIEVVETATGQSSDGPLGSGEGRPLFSADGRHLASVTSRGIQVWSGSERDHTLAHAFDAIDPSAAFDPDGRVIRYLDEGTVVTLDVGALLSPVRLTGTTDESTLSPDGRLLAGRLYDSDRIVLWDTRRRTPVGAPLRVGEDDFVTMAFGPDSRTLAVSRSSDSGDGLVIDVWDAPASRRIATVSDDGQADVKDMALSEDGRLLAAVLHPPNASSETVIRLWDLPSGERRWSLPQQEVGGIAFRPGGALLGVAGGANRLVDAATGKPTGAPYGVPSRNVRVTALAFSPDGSRLALGASAGPDDNVYAGRLSFWDTAGRGALGTPLPAGSGGVYELAYSPRGDVVATVVNSLDVMLWDARSGLRLGRPITVHAGVIESVAFTADGSRLLTAGADGVLAEHVIDPAQAATAVCARAGRTLTEEEWRAHLPGLPYRDVCPGQRPAE